MCFPSLHLRNSFTFILLLCLSHFHPFFHQFAISAASVHLCVMPLSLWPLSVKHIYDLPINACFLANAFHSLGSKSISWQKFRWCFVWRVLRWEKFPISYSNFSSKDHSGLDTQWRIACLIQPAPHHLPLHITAPTHKNQNAFYMAA